MLKVVYPVYVIWSQQILPVKLLKTNLKADSSSALPLAQMCLALMHMLHTAPSALRAMQKQTDPTSWKKHTILYITQMNFFLNGIL